MRRRRFDIGLFPLLCHCSWFCFLQLRAELNNKLQLVSELQGRLSVTQAELDTVNNKYKRIVTEKNLDVETFQNTEKVT